MEIITPNLECAANVYETSIRIRDLPYLIFPLRDVAGGTWGTESHYWCSACVSSRCCSRSPFGSSSPAPWSPWVVRLPCLCDWKKCLPLFISFFFSLGKLWMTSGLALNFTINIHNWKWYDVHFSIKISRSLTEHRERSARLLNLIPIGNLFWM